MVPWPPCPKKSIMKTIPRILGEYSTHEKGPLLFVTAGVHGNEPEGVYALQTIFEILNDQNLPIKGKIVGVSGNRKALSRNVRFIDEDLNRVWSRDNIESGQENSHEKKEMFQIIDVLDRYPKTEFTERYFLDCHTTSSATRPYISVQEKNRNEQWAQNFPTYTICGFSDMVSDDIDHYESHLGFTGFVFEGGQQGSQLAVDHHKGMIWLAMHHAGMLDLNALEEYPGTAQNLEDEQEEQQIFEIQYRHTLNDSDNFKMEPGYENFQKISKGELLAYQNGEPVYSDWNAYIFMPLYQDQGEAGFFVADKSHF